MRGVGRIGVYDGIEGTAIFLEECLVLYDHVIFNGF